MILIIRSGFLRSFICLLITSSFMVTRCIPAGMELAVNKQPSVFGKGRFLQTDGNKVYFSRLEMLDTTFIYQPIAETMTRSVLPGQVLKVEVQKGSYILEFGLGLGLLGLVASLAGNEYYKHHHFGPVGSQSGTIVGVTAGSVIIGLLIGATQKKYVKVYPGK